MPEQSPRCADLCSAESRCSVNRGGEAAAAVSVLSAAEAVESARTGAPLLSVDIFAVGLEADRGERRSGVYPAPLGVGGGLACRLGRGFCGYAPKVATGDPHPYGRRRRDLKSDENLRLSSDFKHRYAQCLPIIKYFPYNQLVAIVYSLQIIIHRTHITAHKVRALAFSFCLKKENAGKRKADSELRSETSLVPAPPQFIIYAFQIVVRHKSANAPGLERTRTCVACFASHVSPANGYRRRQAHPNAVRRSQPADCTA